MWIDLRGSVTDHTAIAQLVEAVLGRAIRHCDQAPVVRLPCTGACRSFLEEHSAFFFRPLDTSPSACAA